MVRTTKGQSIVEFILILTVLTGLGIYMAWKMWPTTSGTGAIVNVQANAALKIGNDK